MYSFSLFACLFAEKRYFFRNFSFSLFSMKKVFSLSALLAMGFLFSACETPQGDISVDTGDTKVNISDGKTSVTTGDTSVKVDENALDAVPVLPEAGSENIILVVDASGSMNETLGTKKRIAIAKDSVRKIVEGIPSQVNVGVMVYGLAGDNTQEGKKASCETIQDLYPLGTLQKKEVVASVEALKPNGWTPITLALKEAEQTLLANPAEKNHIILISDGEETCGGNPLALASELAKSGISLDVVGLGVEGEVGDYLRQIAVNAAGNYLSVQDENGFSAIFETDGSLSVRAEGAAVDISEEGDLNVVTDDANVNMGDGNLNVVTDDATVDLNKGNLNVVTDDAVANINDAGEIEVSVPDLPDTIPNVPVGDIEPDLPDGSF